MTLLVVAGEPSGDRAAARVLSRLGVPAFGIGGDASARAGLSPCAPVEREAAMGLLDVVRRAPRLARSMLAVRKAVVTRRPRVALLVNYTEYNARLLGMLRRRGVRVVWYAAPQVWAWRAGRARTLARGIDAMAVVLPFEEALWRGHGVDARYVGHPAMEGERLSRAAARGLMGLPAEGTAVAVIPGSRPGEVRRLLGPMLGALGDVTGVVLLSTALDLRTRAWVRALATRQGVRVHDTTDGVSRVLGAFDAALCASGTASLECAAAGVPPVVAYRLDPIAGAMARMLVRSDHVALPNVLLGRRAFPELMQGDATAPRMARALRNLLATDASAACDAVREALGPAHEPSRAVAAMIARWL